MTPTIRKTFGANGFGGSVTQYSLGKPTAVYPGAVATDSDMIIAVDRQQTRLALPMSTTDSSMTVVDPSVIVAYSLLTIDAETVKVTGPPVGNVVPVSRAFDGSTAAVHLASAVVSGFVDAYHHNRLVAEVEAIEQTLGANLSRIPGSPWVISTNFIFPAQTPGGTLIAGNNSINLTPVPAGVNGTDQGHYLFISGGTGAAEPALITGGSAVAGAPSGTLIVQCANAHSGAWTIQTATAGIQEAISSLTSSIGGTVYVPAGNFSIYASITISGKYVAVVGVRGAQLTDFTPAGMNVFQVSPAPGGGTRNAIMGFLIYSGKSTDSAIYIGPQNTMLLRDLYISGGPLNGITIAANANTFGVYIEDVNVSLASSTAGACIQILGGPSAIPGGIYLTHVQGSSGLYGLYVSGVSGLYVNQCDFIQPGYGVMIAPGSGSAVRLTWFSDVSFDTCTANGLQISPSGTGIVNSMEFTRLWTATCTGIGVVINGPPAQVDGIRFMGLRAVNNQNTGIQLNGGKNLHFLDCTAAGNSTGSTGIFYGLEVSPGVSDFQVIGGTYGPTDHDFLDSQAWGIYVHAGASDRYQITNTNARGNTVSPMRDDGTGLFKIVNNNAGVDDAVILTIASAASISLGSTDQPVYYISGTTPIATIQGGWRNRQIILIFTDPAPAGLTTGGNIARAQTAVTSQSLRLTFDGTKWF